MFRFVFAVVALSCLLSTAYAAHDDVVALPGLTAEEAAEGFVPLFDGKSLAGWVGLGGDTSSYYVKDGMLICKDTGKVHIFTDKEYANLSCGCRSN